MPFIHFSACCDALLISNDISVHVITEGLPHQSHLPLHNSRTKVFRSVRLGDRQDHRKILNFRGSFPSIVPLLHDNKSPLAPLIVSTHQLDLLKQCFTAGQAVSCVQLVQLRGCRRRSAVGELGYRRVRT